MDTQGCHWRSNPGLKLANAFGVFATEPLLLIGPIRPMGKADLQSKAVVLQ